MPGLIPFLKIAPPISSFISIFDDYVITAHTVGHDVMGNPDITNGSSRFGDSGTEDHLSLPRTD
jgi:hypothetical protein